MRRAGRCLEPDISLTLPCKLNARFLILLYLLLHGCSSIVYTQIPGIRKYSLQDGFTATNGYLIEQDDQGYLWIGTDNGGLCFDGKRFRQLQEANHSGDADILQCVPLNHNHIILVPVTGNIRYLDHDRLISAAEDPRLAHMGSPSYNVMIKDAITSTWWLSEKKQMGALYRFQGKEILPYPISAHGEILHYVINSHFYYTDSTPSIYVYNINAGSTQPLYNEKGNMIAREEYPLFMAHPSKYIVTFNKPTNQVRVYQVHLNRLQWIRSIQLPYPLPIREAIIDGQNKLWLNCWQNKEIIYCGSITEGDAPTPLFHLAISKMMNSPFIDRDGNIWVTTKNNALYFLSEKHFRNALLLDRFPLKTEIPQSISGDGKQYICISYANSKTVASITDHGHSVVALDNFFIEGSRSILPLEHNRYILFGTKIACFDMDKQAISYLQIPGATYKDVCRYGKDGLLVASDRGVIYVHSLSKKKTTYQTLLGTRSSAIGVLANQYILIGTPVGLYQKKELDALPVKVNSPQLSKANITDILTLPGGRSLIGTFGQGLYLYDTSGALQIMPQHGNTLNRVRQLYEQDSTTYWASTDEGACSITFNPDWSVKKMQNYNYYDGLPSNNVTSIYVCRDTAYIATTEGLGIIPLRDTLRWQMTPPDIYINKVQAEETVFHYPYNGRLTLTRKQNNILISLSAISYESLGNVKYFYRLYPYQTEWVQTNDPDIRFAQLPPGVFTFEAYALNAKGTRSTHIVAQTISIRPAFWQTLYFKVILFLLTSVLIYLIMRYSIQRRQKKKYETIQQKKRLAELELEAIKAQINPHFIYNCLNSIQYLNYKAAYQEAQQYLDLFARMIRLTLQYSQQAFVSLTEEMEYLSNYLQLEKLRFKEKLKYDIELKNNVPMDILLPAMLIQPYVENALKHGIAGNKEQGYVLVMFEQIDASLKITISDNGPGFSKQQSSGTLGLRISGKRAQTYNELFNLSIDIHFSNQQDQDPATTGAIVTIIIPPVNTWKPYSAKPLL